MIDSLFGYVITLMTTAITVYMYVVRQFSCLVMDHDTDLANN